MSKLFNLKEWVTLPDAAKHLSAVFGEEVTEADILRLSLDGRLCLSVNFVNHAKGRLGDIVGIEDAEFIEVQNGFPGPLGNLIDVPGVEKGKPVRIYTSIPLDNEKFIKLDDDVETIRGIWDLPLIGGEKLDLEHQYQDLTGGPAVTLTTLDGAFVQAGGRVCQLQADYEDNEYSGGSLANLRKLDEALLWECDGDKAAELRGKREKLRKDFLENRRRKPKVAQYYPAGGLPDDSVLVVRTSNLTAFIEGINGGPSIKKDLGDTERSSLQKQIAALALLLAHREGRYKGSDGPNANAIASDVTVVLDSMPNANKRGVSSASLRASIKAGIDLIN